MNEEPDICPICTDNLGLQEDLIVLPCNPKHVFHTKCILSWAKMSAHPTCPLDRQLIPFTALFPLGSFNCVRMKVSFFLEGAIEGVAVFLWLHHLWNQRSIFITRCLIDLFSDYLGEIFTGCLYPPHPELQPPRISLPASTKPPVLFFSKVAANVVLTLGRGLDQETVHFVVQRSLEGTGKWLSEQLVERCNIGYDYSRAKSLVPHKLINMAGFFVGLTVLGALVRPAVKRVVDYCAFPITRLLHKLL